MVTRKDQLMNDPDLIPANGQDKGILVDAMLAIEARQGRNNVAAFDLAKSPALDEYTRMVTDEMARRSAMPPTTQIGGQDILSGASRSPLDQLNTFVDINLQKAKTSKKGQKNLINWLGKQHKSGAISKDAHDTSVAYLKAIPERYLSDLSMHMFENEDELPDSFKPSGPEGKRSMGEYSWLGHILAFPSSVLDGAVGGVTDGVTAHTLAHEISHHLQRSSGDDFGDLREHFEKMHDSMEDYLKSGEEYAPTRKWKEDADRLEYDAYMLRDRKIKGEDVSSEEKELLERAATVQDRQNDVKPMFYRGEGEVEEWLAEVMADATVRRFAEGSMPDNTKSSFRKLRNAFLGSAHATKSILSDAGHDTYADEIHNSIISNASEKPQEGVIPKAITKMANWGKHIANGAKIQKALSRGDTPDTGLYETASKGAGSLSKKTKNGKVISMGATDEAKAEAQDIANTLIAQGNLPKGYKVSGKNSKEMHANLAQHAQEHTADNLLKDSNIHESVHDLMREKAKKIVSASDRTPESVMQSVIDNHKTLADKLADSDIPVGDYAKIHGQLGATSWRDREKYDTAAQQADRAIDKHLQDKRMRATRDSNIAKYAKEAGVPDDAAEAAIAKFHETKGTHNLSASDYFKQLNFQPEGKAPKAGSQEDYAAKLADRPKGMTEAAAIDLLQDHKKNNPDTAYPNLKNAKYKGIKTKAHVSEHIIKRDSEESDLTPSALDRLNEEVSKTVKADPSKTNVTREQLNGIIAQNKENETLPQNYQQLKGDNVKAQFDHMRDAMDNHEFDTDTEEMRDANKLPDTYQPEGDDLKARTAHRKKAQEAHARNLDPEKRSVGELSDKETEGERVKGVVNKDHFKNTMKQLRGLDGAVPELIDALEANDDISKNFTTDFKMPSEGGFSEAMDAIAKHVDSNREGNTSAVGDVRRQAASKEISSAIEGKAAQDIFDELDSTIADPADVEEKPSDEVEDKKE